jgi:hypothetical protein
MIELELCLQELNEIYNYYCRIKYSYMILGWDRNASCFYIKDNGPAPESISFHDFLKHARYWSPAC